MSKWSLEGSVTELRARALAGRIDIARPELGLHDIEVAGQTLPGRLFCITRGADSERGNVPPTSAAPSWPLAVADAYSRGDDLVATYNPSEDWPYSPQVYWRAGSVDSCEGLAASVSLLVSVQTHLLDTWPRIIVDSQLQCTEVLNAAAHGGNQLRAEALPKDTTIQPSAGDCCIIRRLADMPLSYVEIMPASDFRHVVVHHESDGICRVSWELFADFLEKGVIRRSRLHSAFVERANDVELAAACGEAMARSSLPLTT